MAISKTYLNVPYAEKDAAKALGARWDATQKKWFVPGDKDRALFAKWLPADEAKEQSATPTGSGASTGVTTYPASKDFVAYDGDAPPWA